MDFTPVVNAAAQAGAEIVTTIVLPLILAWAARRWNINTQWTTALEQAAGTAYSAAVSSGKPITDPAARGAALAAGVEYLRSQVKPAVLSAAGVKTEAALASAVEAGLGKLLARDPSVTVGAAGTTAVGH
ncbi:hypothetical protein [Granulibacter bethesdensis]|uniref:hypothetical protein n=1 Tax=Granulibacter bethesdensis TaxID=364410 RepID=UPI0003F1D4BD|nr:hypothetical protein [Granulibacter bethesdensis]APG31125.1 Hypothetical protein GbCGDNIH4_1547a [Granulibacter bethesdensis CGDNIH4]